MGLSMESGEVRSQAKGGRLMGITTVITCDDCQREIPEKKEDFASISCNFELDRFLIHETDERDGLSGVFCEACARSLWAELKAAFGREDERHPVARRV